MYIEKGAEGIHTYKTYLIFNAGNIVKFAYTYNSAELQSNLDVLYNSRNR